MFPTFFHPYAKDYHSSQGYENLMQKLRKFLFFSLVEEKLQKITKTLFNTKADA